MSKVVGAKRRWRVAREMVFGLFSFAKLLMYKDLDKARWPTAKVISEHSNVQKVLVGGGESCPSEDKVYGEEYEIDNNAQAESVPLILDADSSQHSAIMDALSGKNLVIEGPPGTGKSQTITNLIVAALSDGKSVLFVAEKKAALEVVRRRLDHVGHGDFCLELHSHKTQKGQLHSDIKKRLSRSYQYSSKLIRLVDEEEEDLQHEKEKLNSYVNLINKSAGPSGETIHDILWSAERWRTEVSDQYGHYSVSNTLKLTRRDINERIDKLEDIVKTRKELSSAALDAWNGIPIYNLFAGDEERIKELFTTFSRKTSTVLDNLNKVKSGTRMPLKESLIAIKDIAGVDTKIVSPKSCK